jgi:Zn-dependent protease
VPVDFGRLRHPKRDMLWVAAAGPAANFLMLIGWACLFKYGASNPGSVYGAASQAMGLAGMMINASLMLLNLLPLPPLDGGRIVFSLLPHRMAWNFAKIEPYGLIILILLLVTHVLHAILMPPMQALMGLIQLLFNF